MCQCVCVIAVCFHSSETKAQVCTYFCLSERRARVPPNSVRFHIFACVATLWLCDSVYVNV